MGLRDIGATLPPGFRFYPSDEELVCHYLYNKICNEEILKGTTLVEIDLHTCEPWQLPDVAKLNANEWYFFSFRDRKYATGFRTNRATVTGYWKATGKDRTVHDPVTKDIVGMRKTLVFHRNRAPNGIKTGWIMHEFRFETPRMPPKEDWVLCRVFQRTKSQEYKVFDTNNLNHGQINCLNLNTNHDALITTLTSSPWSNALSFFDHDILDNNRTAFFPRLHHEQAQNDHVPSISHDIESSKAEDDHGFVWDGNIMEEGGVENGVSSNLGNLRFEMDCSIVFL